MPYCDWSENRWVLQARDTLQQYKSNNNNNNNNNNNTDHRVKLKESEKRGKYQDLPRELKNNGT